MPNMHKANPCYYVNFLLLLFSFLSCRSKQTPAVSFYYWKTRFELNQYENNILTRNKVPVLYVRYFDIDIDAGSGQPKPVSVITFDSSFIQKTIIPVVYIKNQVFVQKDSLGENADSAGIVTLSKNVFQLIAAINQKIAITPSEVQFDCDWTEKTKDEFFLFLNHYKKISGQKLSVTIRLHQVKYSQRTGIPPVDEGVLMFYNMGTISASDVNSIYEERNALKYVSSLKRYPLSLDIALPIFSWGIGTRHGKVHYLLNKMYLKDFEKDTNFVRLAGHRFKARHSFFKSGYYILQDDEIKVENVNAEELSQMASMLKKNISYPVKKIIFYDLDSSNFINYESDIFQTVSQELR